MFKDTLAFSGFSVDDIAAAKTFYGEVLGLPVTEADGMLRLTLGTGGTVLVYPKGPGHAPATYTMLNFPVDDIESTVDALVQRGVEFVRYEDMPQDDRGIMREGGPLIAWFTDPAGNILAVLQQS